MARIARLEKTLKAEATGLILFDTLNGYLHPNERAKQEFLAEHNVLANLQRLLAGARRVGMTTFYPCGAHAADGSDIVERLTDTDMDLGPGGDAARPIRPRFTKGSREAEIAAELRPGEGDVVIPKHRWNAFHQTDLDLHLRVRGIETIIIAGGSTDVGIAATVYAARDMDYGIVVVRDACYSMRGNNNAFFMERVFPRMGRVMTVDDTVALMRQ
ncbi:MAG TPA: isochorismatase family cysteine hydrolase [Hyphomicrobiaceae bacterium]|nr:isochorismatase family cysteine hydrolase [Hyphomicrobiaceae bacterium]